MKHWLDTIAEKQAAYYGMTVEKHGKLMSDVAQYLEDTPEHEEVSHQDPTTTDR